MADGPKSMASISGFASGRRVMRVDGRPLSVSNRPEAMDCWLFSFNAGRSDGPLIVEKLFWNGPLTIRQLKILNVPIELAINAAVWLLCAKIL
jgi:hypothetical protein